MSDNRNQSGDQGKILAEAGAENSVNITTHRSGLRLIVSKKLPANNHGEAEEGTVSASDATKRPASGNSFVAMMDAYADAIDRDVAMILGF